MRHIGRREFITLLGGAAAAWPVTARAQQDGGMRRIGVLTSFPEDDPEIKERLVGFRQGLQRLAWSEGRNIRIEYRYGPGGAEHVQLLAKELVDLQCDVILAHTIQPVEALQRETRTIPVIFVGMMDPVAQGIVPSLARPGGNFTGFMQFEASIAGKWMAMLREIAPGLTRAALMGDRSYPSIEYFMRAAEAAAPALAIKPVPIQVETDADVESAIEAFARVPSGGLVVLPLNLNMYRRLIIPLAARYRLPAVYASRFWVAEGGLMSYGIDRVNEFRQAAIYVDRILRGDRPADLPVQAPVKYETVLNLKTAKALGLTVPDLLLVRADEVIE